MAWVCLQAHLSCLAPAPADRCRGQLLCGLCWRGAVLSWPRGICVDLPSALGKPHPRGSASRCIFQLLAPGSPWRSSNRVGEQRQDMPGISRLLSPVHSGIVRFSPLFTGHQRPRGSPHLTVGPGWPRGSPASSRGCFPSPPHHSEELHNPRGPLLGCAAGDQGPGDRARPSPGWGLGGGWPGRYFLWW